MDEGVRRPRKAHPEELGHCLVEIDDDRNANDAERETCQDEKVRQGVDDDRRIVPSSMGGGRRAACPDEEREVLPQICSEAGSLVTLDIQTPQPDALELLNRWEPRTAEGEHVHRTAPRDERFGLAADPRILLVVGMDKHADRAQRRRRWDHSGHATGFGSAVGSRPVRRRVGGSFSYTRPMDSRRNADRAVPALVIAGAAVAFIVLVLAGGAFYQSFDEAKYVGLGRNLLAGRGYMTVFGSLFLTHPPAWPLILAAPEAWFGVDPLAVGRLLNALSGTGLIALTGLLAWRIRPAAAIWAASVAR